MTTSIFAKAASFTDDGYCTLLGFADDPDKPVNYVMLSMTNQPDQQDLDLAHGGVHIDAGALRVNGYDLVEDLRETDTGVVVRLILDAAQNMGGGQDIEIELGGTVDKVPLSEAVRKFRDRLAFARDPAR